MTIDEEPIAKAISLLEHEKTMSRKQYFKVRELYWNKYKYLEELTSLFAKLEELSINISKREGQW